MRFFSDNAAPVHPAVMQALADANQLDTAYDGDRLSQRLDAAFSDVFEADVTVLWVATGTAANSIALANMVEPHQAAYCHQLAHIEVDECGAPGFFTHGAKLILLEGEGAKISPEVIRQQMATIRNDVHQVQPAAVSITNATEYGLTYRSVEVAALGAACQELGLSLHMDGARFANAVASTGCHPGDVTHRANVKALSFGFVKNGGMSAEALVFFDKALGDKARFMRKRAGHLQSKGRFLAAQLLAMLGKDLWLENACRANEAATILAQAAAGRLLYPVEANELFLRLSAAEAQTLRDAGYDFYDWGESAARFVTSWHHCESDVAPLAKAISAL